MEMTTIKLQKTTKSSLDRLKNKNESYDQLIQKILSETKKKNLRKRLIEGYKAMGKQDLEILREWETASAEI